MLAISNYEYATFLLNEKELEESKKYFNKCLNSSKEVLEKSKEYFTRNILFNIYFHLGEIEIINDGIAKAIEYHQKGYEFIEKILNDFPQEEYQEISLHQLGLICYSLGIMKNDKQLTNKAISSLKKVLEINPKNESAREKLTDLMK